MDELRVVAQLMPFVGLGLLLVVAFSSLRMRKLSWFLLGAYAMLTTLMTAATVELSTLDDALSVVGYLSGPVATCVCFGVAVWLKND